MRGASLSSLSHLVVSLLLAASSPSAVLADGTVWATPHDSYSSSVGVLGCKINTDRVAYWPGSVDCNNLCISLSYEDRTVKLLRIDQSQGAYDISYDAWNYLYTGNSAKKLPVAGGPLAMEYKELHADECKELIKTKSKKLPLSASNSMNFLASCLDQKDSWVAKNFALYNMLDSICSWGYDEGCELDWPTANQPTCKHSLGMPVELTDAPVYNVQYPTGNVVEASSGEKISSPGDSTSDATTTFAMPSLPVPTSYKNMQNGASALGMLGMLMASSLFWTCFILGSC
ncbi:hypothetical protein CkaCkLH20_04442 [Colletotrichum karsti]|uniref:Uncharacterized protein n=1 Tax=Colletotrichum karsti TaxID=1095194 RepID=A0A9P6IC85_9PEZI|nr:uncharacterized protein CkaCkLH20_04442 [Colletotrichum karsti]KAF9877866.1 hypothetical protein CkaCkLH20_04442 [Colletotrichum karsti]